MRRTLSWIALTMFAALIALTAWPGGVGRAETAGTKNVYVLKIDNMQQIDQGLVEITRRAFEEAEADPNTAALVIELDTPGGYVHSALAMQKLILNSKVKSVAFVNQSAWSAGALIATAAEKLYMHPGSSIGAAEPRLTGSNEKADYKTVSALVEAFRSTAIARNRPADLAAAMVDTNAKVPGQTQELLVLSAQSAAEKKYADGVADSLEDALRQAGVTDYRFVNVEPTPSEAVGRFLTQQWVAILLLVAGVIAIGVEFMKPGLTLPGLIGIVCLGLFFLGNVLVGTAGWLELGLALLGVLLLVIEAFVPGFGVFGVGGVVAMGASIFFSVPTPEMAFSYLMWTSVAFALALFGIIRTISRRGLGKWLTLEKGAAGWVPPRNDLSGLVGKEGKALTVLRPAGTALVGADKVDVVTEGEFVAAGTPVKVLRVDGTRVVVRALQ